MFNVTDVFERLMDLEGDILDEEINDIKETFILSYPEERQTHIRQQIWILGVKFNKYKNPTERMNLIISKIVNKIRELDNYLNG